MLSAGPTPHLSTDRWEFTITTETGQEHTWSWAELLALPAEDVTVDLHCVTNWSKLGHRLARGVRSTRCSRTSRRRPTTPLVHSLRRLHHQPAARGPARRAGLGRLRVRRRAARRRARRPGPAAGAAPVPVEVGQVGARAPAAARGRARASGRRPATTTTATRGASSGTRATEPPRLAGRHASCEARSETAVAPARWSSTCPTGPGHLPGPARRRAADRRRRLHRRSAATRSPRRPTATASSSPSQRVAGRRGLAVPRATTLEVGDPCELRGPVGGWFVWRPGEPGAGAAGRRRLRGRAADGDDPRAAGAGEPGAVPARLLGADARDRHLRRRTAFAGGGRPRPRRRLRVHPRGARRTLPAARPHHRRRREQPRRGRRTSSRPATSAARRRSSRRWRTSWWRSATTPADQDRRFGRAAPARPLLPRSCGFGGPRRALLRRSCGNPTR